MTKGQKTMAAIMSLGDKIFLPNETYGVSYNLLDQYLVLESDGILENIAIIGFVCLNDMAFIQYDTMDPTQDYLVNSEDVSFFATHEFLYSFNHLFARMNKFHNTTFFQS